MKVYVFLILKNKHFIILIKFGKRIKFEINTQTKSYKLTEAFLFTIMKSK